MALINAFARMDATGKIEIPRNVRTALDLRARDVVELKVVRAGSSDQATLSKRENNRWRKRHASTTRAPGLLHRRK